jgi:uncharacterized membrane protein YhaH (DUF805 family)
MAGKPVKGRKLLVRSVLSRVVRGNLGRWVRPSPSGELSEDTLGRLSVYFLYMHISKYFEGRTNKRDYLLTSLLAYLVFVAIGYVVLKISPPFYTFVGIVVVTNALLLPLITRRMHDIGHSGWWVLLVLPFIGLSWVFSIGLIFYKGSKFPNRWGGVPTNSTNSLYSFLYATNDIREVTSVEKEQSVEEEIEKEIVVKKIKKQQSAEFMKNLLIAAPPAVFLHLSINALGIVGFLVPVVCYFGGALVVGEVRKKYSKVPKHQIRIAYFSIIAVFVSSYFILFSMNAAT